MEVPQSHRIKMLTSRLMSPVVRSMIGQRSMSAIGGPAQTHVPKGVSCCCCKKFFSSYSSPIPVRIQWESDLPDPLLPLQCPQYRHVLSYPVLSNLKVQLRNLVFLSRPGLLFTPPHYPSCYPHTAHLPRVLIPRLFLGETRFGRCYGCLLGGCSRMDSGAHPRVPWNGLDY